MSEGTQEKKMPEAGTPGKNVPDSNPQEEVNIGKEILGWIRIVIIAVVAAYLINNFVIINANIPSESMETTIMKGDRIIGLRFAYANSDPERGDIVIFKYPLDTTETYIKRVIGLPGETVMIDTDGSVTIKTASGGILTLDETYINGDMIVEEYQEYELGEDEYFMMGDNRNNSSDSRVWGTVNRDLIIAKAVFRYWPFSEFGTIE